MDLDICRITWPGGVDGLGPWFLLDIHHLVCPLHSSFHTALGSVGTCHSILQWFSCCVHLHDHVLVLGLLQPIPCQSLHLGVSFTGICARFPYYSHPYRVRGESLLKGGKELKKDREFSIRGLQTELKVLHPLTEFKDQTEEDGEAFS